MLHQMCHEVLATVDMNVIRKARGFSQSESASRSTFENAFISSAGLASVMASLSEAEGFTLHLLSSQPKPVDISFFERLYGSKAEEKYFRLTFSQKYKETLDAVKKSLVRKGVLGFAEEKNNLDSVQMERWRFFLPPAFAQFLPPLLSAPHPSMASGDLQTSMSVHKLREALGAPPASAKTMAGPYQLTLHAGTLLFGKQSFQVSLLHKWQQDTWKAELSDYGPGHPASLSTVDATRAILSTLAPNQWVTAKQLGAPLKIFAFGEDLPAAARICQTGWKLGCLARLSEDGETYYRLPLAATEDAANLTDFGAWLQASPAGGPLLVDLDHIPLAVLEQLNALARLSADQERLLAQPDLVKLGQACPEVRQSPLAGWLRAQVPAFQQALDLIEQRWGKVIVHSNLLVARVRDLSLRVQLERELKDQVVLLSDEFIAFPTASRADVERVLRKTGFVVKEVKA